MIHSLALIAWGFLSFNRTTERHHVKGLKTHQILNKFGQLGKSNSPFLSHTKSTLPAATLQDHLDVKPWWWQLATPTSWKDPALGHATTTQRHRPAKCRGQTKVLWPKGSQEEKSQSFVCTCICISYLYLICCCLLCFLMNSCNKESIGLYTELKMFPSLF